MDSYISATKAQLAFSCLNFLLGSLVVREAAFQNTCVQGQTWAECVTSHCWLLCSNRADAALRAAEAVAFLYLSNPMHSIRGAGEIL